ncbi:5315_t:CDS:1, partial [Racocetra persica]
PGANHQMEGLCIDIVITSTYETMDPFTAVTVEPNLRMRLRIALV